MHKLSPSAHARGDTFQEVEQSVRQYMERGFRTIRVQVTVPRLATYGMKGRPEEIRQEPNNRVQLWDPKPYVRLVPKLFEYLRKHVGDEVELLHDVHERVPPILAIQLARDLESYRLFFLEDPLRACELMAFFHRAG